MEKRLVISFVLSFLVLYIWASLAPKSDNVQSEFSREAETILESEQITDLKDVKDPASLGSSIPTASQSSKIIEENYTLENELFILTFSNKGGNLKSVYLKEYKTLLPVTNIVSLPDFNASEFSISSQTEKQVIFEYVSEELKIVKMYTILENEYIIDADISIINLQEMSKKISTEIKSFTLNMANLDNAGKKLEDVDEKKDVSAQRDRGLNEYVINSTKGIKRKNNAFKFSDKDRVTGDDPINWLGFRNRYYTAIVEPKFDNIGHSIKNIEESSADFIVRTEDFTLAPQEGRTFSTHAFVGPEKIALLKQYDSGLEDIQRYYKFGLFDGIAKIIYKMMNVIHKVVPNWGLCIIIISVIIYYSMYPLTAKGMASMRRMQALQPKIQALKEKHEKNPQKLNQEMLELYKREKINPLGGCLPILFQMPVFIGLYQVLWRNVEFKGANFLWIQDLSRPDRLFVLDFSLPIIGNEINLLPLLMVVIMFFQQKFSSRNMTLTDPAQIQQQKMMMMIMPIFLGFIFYKFASGLTLYFTMFYIFSTITQWKISQSPKAA